MTGYAIGKNNAWCRAVDGPEADPDDAWRLFPDPKTETYSEIPVDPVAVPPSASELISMANSQRDSLLGIAALRIAPLQDAVDLGSATDADTDNLKLWKQYRVDVNRVSAQAGFPAAIVWPSSPGAGASA